MMLTEVITDLKAEEKEMFGLIQFKSFGRDLLELVLVIPAMINLSVKKLPSWAGVLGTGSKEGRE